jgi:hypothetical protein
MTKLMHIKTKTCKHCKETYPATSEYFRRDATKPDGWSFYCKTCAKNMQRPANKEYYNRNVEVKGVLGWRCPLWTKRCGECRVINTCWRIVNDEPEDLPVKLVGKRVGTLRKGEKDYGKSFRL